MKVYEFIMIYHPDKEERKAGQKDRIIELDGTNGPTNIQVALAKDEKVVAVQAARMIPESYAEKLDQVEIAIRPF